MKIDEEKIDKIIAAIRKTYKYSDEADSLVDQLFDIVELAEWANK